MRVGRGLAAFLMVSVVGATACRDSAAPSPTPANTQIRLTKPVLDLNADLFDITWYPCAETPALTADLDSSVNVLWTGVSKRFTPARGYDSTTVAWRSDPDTWPQQYRTLIVGAPAYAPKYQSAWLRSSQATYNGLSTVFHIKEWRTANSFYCRNQTATIRSSDPFTWHYIVGNQGNPQTSWTLAIGEDYSLGAQARNVDGYYVPVLSNDTQGNPIPSANLSVTSTSAAVTMSAVTNSGWNAGFTIMTGAQPGTARARFSLRGFVDSSFTINVCSPAKNVATWIYVAPGGPLTLEIYQDTTLVALTANCAGHIPGGSVTWTSDNPSVASVSAQGLVSPQQTGTAKIIAQKDAVADTVLITVPTPAIQLELVGPWSVKPNSSCSWQVYATNAHAPGTYHYSWTKDGIPIGYDQSYVTGVSTGSTQFGIFITVTHSSGLYPPATISRNVTIDPNAPDCHE